MEWIVFIPSLVALILSLILRNAFMALSTGAIVGAIIFNFNQLTELPGYLYHAFIGNHIFSSWKMGAFLLTLQLGALSALLDKNQSLERFFNSLNKANEDKKKSLTSLALMGLVCFYDGLANSILLGRLSIKLKNRFPISNEKLAYIVDSTSSSVACLVIFSTWTAYQISLLQTAIEGSELKGQGLTILVQSIPFNIYSLLTLVMVFIVINKDFNLGPMKTAEQKAGPIAHPIKTTSIENSDFKLFKSMIPIIVLFFSFLIFVLFLSFQLNNNKSLFHNFIQALSSNHIPWLLNLSALCSWLCLIVLREQSLLSLQQALKVSLHGFLNILKPCMILFGAWALSFVIADLGAGQVIADLFSSVQIKPQWLPFAVFIISCITAFFTGTSWGTLALIIPLVVPVAASLGVDSVLTSATVGAIFGGAVFGDHCSPLSDTSVVSSFATECELKQHVLTQLPYALLTAIISSTVYLILVLFL